MMVQKKARLHEKTVQKVARGEIKRTRKSPVARRVANSRVKTQQIEPLLKAWLEENNISPDRIKIEGPNSIVIKNPKG
jgi:hypothetical protein